MVERVRPSNVIPLKPHKKSGPKKAHTASFKKGKDGRRGNGRPPGAANKLPLSVKEAAIEAMGVIGGKAGMVGFFVKAFLFDYSLGVRIAEKILPTQVTGIDGILKKLGGMDLGDSKHQQPLQIEYQPGDAAAYAKDIGITEVTPPTKRKTNGDATKH